MAGPVRRGLPEWEAPGVRYRRDDRPVGDLQGSPSAVSPPRSDRHAAAAVRPPAPKRRSDLPALQSDEDWAQCLQLRIACKDNGQDGDAQFASRRRRTERAITEAGHGGWFGAFLDGRLVAQMGLLNASPGLARFQSVETTQTSAAAASPAPWSTTSSRYGFNQLGATTLVMVADPEHSRSGSTARWASPPPRPSCRPS